MREYYYLISSLPDPELDSQKKNISMSEFVSFCEEQLHRDDLENLKKVFIFNDIINAVKVKNEDSPFKSPSYYDKETFLENMSDYGSFFPFIEHFFENRKNDKRDYPELLELDELITLMYENIDTLTNNNFLKDYFLFELNLRNIVNSLSLKKLGFSVEDSLIPYGDAYERLSKSLNPDSGIIPLLDRLVESVNGDDLVGTEKLIDEIRWYKLDEDIAHEYFSFKYIIGYAVKLSTIEKWEKLTDETGKSVLDGLINKIKSGIVFSEEFLKTGGKR